MQARRFHCLVVAIALSALLTATARAQITNTVFHDPFEDASRADGADPADLNWWIANMNLALNVVPDNFAGGSSANALNVDIGTIDSFKRIYANFDSVSLGPNVGDQLLLSFDFRALTTGWNNNNLFRFGLYNSNGTVTNADIAATGFSFAETNDFGYNVRVPFGPAAAGNLLKEPPGDNTLGGTIAGVAITNAVGPAYSINDTNKHTFVLTLTRTGVGVDFTLLADGVTRNTGQDTNSPYTTFNIIYFGSGGASGFDYRLDNILLQQVTIPEPSGLFLVLLGTAGLTWIARRRR